MTIKTLKDLVKNPKAMPAIVLLFAILAGVIVHFGLRSQDYSNPKLSLAKGWRTYSNKRYNFQIMYPVEWEVRGALPSKVQGDDPSKNPVLFLNFSKKRTDREAVKPVTLAVYKTETVESLLKKLNKDPNQFENKIKVNGVNVFVDDGYYSSNRNFTAFFNTNSYGFQFVNQDETESEEISEIAKTILASIKFTK